MQMHARRGGWVAEGRLGGGGVVGWVQAHGERAGQRGGVVAVWRRCGGGVRRRCGGVVACLRDALGDDGGHLAGLSHHGARHVDGGGVGGVGGRAELLRRRVGRE